MIQNDFFIKICCYVFSILIHMRALFLSGEHTQVSARWTNLHWMECEIDIGQLVGNRIKSVSIEPVNKIFQFLK